MKPGFFSPRIADIARRATIISSHAQQQELRDRRYLEAALEELNAALEELRVADEELRQQNRELEELSHKAILEHRRYRATFEFAPVGLLVTDAMGSVREANAAACAMLGVARPFLVGKPVQALAEESCRDQLRAMISEVFGATGPVSVRVRLGEGRGGGTTLIATASSDPAGEWGHPIIRWALQHAV